MSAHGPAPWKFVVCEPWDEEDKGKELPLDFSGYENQHSENPMIVDANGDRVVGHSEYNVFHSDRQKENLMLMLAAPDLLKALERCIQRMDQEIADPEDVDEIQFAKTIIAKATGTTE